MAGNEDQQQQVPDDQALNDIIATAVQGMSSGLPSASGIIGNHWGGTAEPWQGVPYKLPETTDKLAEPYHEGDDFSMLSEMNTEQLARFQDTLVATGLVREVVPGRIDDETVRGMGTLMALGNRQAEPWQDILDGIVRAGGLESAKARAAQQFDPKPYVAPDYATIAQEIKATFRQRLGREPDQAEMAQLSSEMFGWDKQGYNQQVAAERQQFENAQTEGEQPGGTFTQVDPLARFQEAFDRRYANELDFVDDKADAVETREQVERTTNTLSAMSRGGA